MTVYPIAYNAACGAVMRIVGAGILAHRSLFALEPARLWSIRFAGIRQTDSDDPVNDAVTRGVAYYDYQYARLAAPNDKALLASITPTIATGRWQDVTTVSRGGGGGAIAAPASARYFRPYVQTFGNTPTTDIEVCGAWDITE